MSQRVLVVDDEASIRTIVEYALRDAGFEVVGAARGDEALKVIEREPIDLVVLDLMLPGVDGLEVCRRIRATRNTPIIMLSARAEELDKVLGLELGADDYVTKPFSPRELVARVKAILRRADGPPREAADVIGVGGVEVDTVRREVRVGAEVVPLATREFDLLQHLATNVGIVLTRRQLLDSVWGRDWYGDERTVDVHVRQLRKKLGDALPLATVWGVGYRLG